MQKFAQNFTYNYGSKALKKKTKDPFRENPPDKRI